MNLVWLICHSRAFIPSPATLAHHGQRIGAGEESARLCKDHHQAIRAPLVPGGTARPQIHPARSTGHRRHNVPFAAVEAVH